MITTTIRLTGLDAAIKKLTKTDMAAIGIKVMELQSEQLTRRRDNTGKRFAPYSAAYAKRKKVSPSNVTLISNARVRSKEGWKQSGHMLTEMGVIRTGKNFVIIGWTTPAKKELAKYNHEQRQFIGLSKVNRARLYKYIRQNILT